MVTDLEQELTDELEEVKTESEGLKHQQAIHAKELEARDTAITRLEQELSGKDAEISVLKQDLTEAGSELADLNGAMARAVAEYKALVIQANPGVFAELVAGDTIEEVNESLKNAQALIERVRQEMEAEAAKTRVPAGAPQRTPQDLSALTPREKIQYAVGGFSS